MLLRTILIGFVLSSTIAVAADGPDVAGLLSRRIIDPNLPLEEVQRYTESRVPPMPEVASVKEWEKHATRMRRETLDKVVFRGEAAKWRTYKGKVEWLETIDGGPEYKIKKLRYEALPGLWIPALLYEPVKLSGKVPVVLNVNGHDRPKGKAAIYKQTRCINQAKRGMLALNVEWLGMGQLHTEGFGHYRMNQLNLCGTSGLAPFYLSMSRGIDVLLSHEHADPKRVAVAGLSGGGWQTIVISSLDTRVTLSDPVAGYSSFRTRARFFSDLGDSEQTPCDLATVTDYAQMTAMLAPNPALLTFNAQDNCCFKASHALPPLLEAARPIYALYGKRDHLRSHVNFDPGSHNFGRDNREALYRMFGEFFFDGASSFSATEIDCAAEIKTKEELHVKIPSDNADFHSLATAISKNLPQAVDRLPTDGKSLKKWRDSRLKLLSETVRAEHYAIQAEQAGESVDGGVAATFWKLRAADRWTLPATELTPAKVNGTTILVADAGRKSVAAEAQKLLADGQRVLAVDPFYFGESKISQRDSLFGLMVSTVGGRPLGLQSSQVAAVARWAHAKYDAPVKIVAVGPRASLYSLIATALEQKAIKSAELHDSYDSLKQVIERNMGVNQAPDLFCFGLLKHFDIIQIAGLASSRRVTFVGTKPRTTAAAKLEPPRKNSVVSVAVSRGKN